MLSYLYSHATPHRLCGRQSGSQAALVCTSAYAYVTMSYWRSPPGRQWMPGKPCSWKLRRRVAMASFRWGFQPPRLAWQGYEQLASE